ncbi:conserved exported protein of unknown function [Rhodovastum atsumiense]|uniref:DUF4142 domain-containing protein n=1 Tax=Rhodovastum atsumiense TaxID=504468 RepID=A0A5M6IV95_9PROT|nr:DUF4142 domain-containing protein [Rhodovastum atsumiense]KAA5611325.1 DUF4142 domain-containing protein [Rhodovastum atsumiense]CAH2601802.1 conserved exported protein of unknown function [Rhodovastum atsumiense]
MTDRRSLLLVAGTAPALFAARSAVAQASLRPDPTPRLPPQPGQGLPAEDVRFLRRAARLSEAQQEAGRLAAAAAATPEIRQLAEAVAGEHATLLRELIAYAAKHGVDLQASEDTSLAGLRTARGEEMDRRFLARQLGLYAPLAEMYQAEASNTPDKELGRLAIAALAALRMRFETARQLGTGYGLSVETVEAPPQY